MNRAERREMERKLKEEQKNSNPPPPPPAKKNSLLSRAGAIIGIISGLASLGVTIYGVFFRLASDEIKLTTVDGRSIEMETRLTKEINLRKRAYQEIFIKSKIPNRTDTLVYDTDPDSIYWKDKPAK